MSDNLESLQVIDEIFETILREANDDSPRLNYTSFVSTGYTHESPRYARNAYKSLIIFLQLRNTTTMSKFIVHDLEVIITNMTWTYDLDITYRKTSGSEPAVETWENFHHEWLPESLLRFLSMMEDKTGTPIRDIYELD